MENTKPQSNVGYKLLNIGGGIAGGIMDILNQKRMFNQQKELNKFNQELQLDTWRKTSYPAQREMMEKAGLNPGLMYGMGGGGGSSIGTQGSSVPQTGSQFGQLAQQTIAQTELLKAQKNNLDADTRNKNVDANKTEGIDTAEGEQRIQTALKNMELTDAEISSLLKTMGKTDEEINNLIQQREVMKSQINLNEKSIEEIGSKIGLNEQQIQSLKEQIKLTKANVKNINQDTLLKKSQIKNWDELTKYIPDRIANEIRNSLANQRNSNANESNALTNTRRQVIDELNKNREFRLLDEKNQREWVDSAMKVITGFVPGKTTETIYKEKGPGWESIHRTNTRN